MAFMMPVVKKNYSLYASPGSSVGGPGSVDPRQRRTSEQVDGRSNPKVSITGPNGVQPGGRRKTKSEGQSLSTSPGGSLLVGSSDVGRGHPQRSRPVEMGGPRRVRGSAGALHASYSLQHSTNFGGRLVLPSTSAPTGDAPPIRRQPSSESRSSLSSSASSSSDSTGTPKGKKFHSKLVMRLRKTFGIKDTEPTST